MDTGGETPYELFRTIDLDQPQGKPGHFICYTEDKGAAKDLSIAFGEDGRAMYARYEGQKGKLKLQLDSSSMDTGGAYPTTTETYVELVDGKKNGTYTLTHSGNWDYAEYKTNSGKTFKFTINHDLSIQGNGYRLSPCF